MAEAVADHVRDPLGVEAACETTTTPLGAVDDPDRRGECPHRDDGDPNQRSDDLIGGSRPCHDKKESSDPLTSYSVPGPCSSDMLYFRSCLIH